MWDALRSLTFGDAAGEQHRFIHTWPWPHWAAALILIVAAITVLAIYHREHTPWRGPARIAISSIRIALIAIVVLVMMYGWNLVKDITELPDLVLVLDESASMLHQDPIEETNWLEKLQRAELKEPSRWNLARAALIDPDRPLLEPLEARYRVKLFRIGQSVRSDVHSERTLAEQIKRWSIEPDAQQHRASRLGAGLRNILDGQRGRPTAAVVVLSDGITTDGETISDVAPYAKRLNIPLYLVALGDERPVRDLRIADLLADDVVFVGDLAHFDFRISGQGYAGQEVNVRLLRADRQEVLAEQKVKIDHDDTAQAVRLSFRPEQVGEMDVRVEASGKGDDINPENNRLSRTISVRDDLIRVLFVQEYPNFEYRTLKAFLERGMQRGGEQKRKAVELHVVLQEADLEYSTVDASAQRAFPVSRNELFQYDVLILGDANPAFFSDSLLENVAAFVTERGGGLILMAGPRHMPWSYRGTPLADLMPVLPDRIQPPDEQQLLAQSFSTSITAQGISHPILQVTDDPAESQQQWSRFPALHWVAATEELRLGARVLLEARAEQQTQPLMCLQFVGAGKVVMLLTDETYRWSRHPAGEVYYARFWLQMIRYLSRSKLLGGDRLVEFTTDQQAYQRGETIQFKVRFLDDRSAPAADDGVTAIIEHHGGRRRTLSLVRDGGHRGVFRADVADLAEGDYRAWLTTPPSDDEPPSLNFRVIAQRGELSRLEIDAADLREAAETSAGNFYTLSNIQLLTRDLPPGRQVRVQTLPPRPLWNAPIWALLFVMLITAEWLLRKKAGML